MRSDLACLVAGFAYALSPRMLTTLGPISIEAWPSALAPWVLLPLVVGSARGLAAPGGGPVRAGGRDGRRGQRRGDASPSSRSGSLWLLTRSRGPRRRALMLWWPVFTLLGTLWWLVPLFVMGAYSPPFLDFIEAVANTTFPTTLFDALRGTSQLGAVRRPALAGRQRPASASPTSSVNSGVLLLLGLAGLARPAQPAPAVPRRSASSSGCSW